MSNYIDRLNALPQFPKDREKGELLIGKNDPKDMKPDYWWASYGKIHLNNYYSLKQLLIDLDKECLKNGYCEQDNEL